MAGLTESLARQIRILRERRMERSMQALASNHLGAKFLGEIELGKKVPSIKKLEAIAKALQMPLWELIRTAEVAAERGSEPPSAERTLPQDEQPRIPPAYPRGPKRQPVGTPRAGAREPVVGPSAGSVEPGRFLVVIQHTGSRYSAHVPDLPGCFAWGASAQALEREMPRAIALHIHRLRALGEPVPDSHSYAILVEPKDATG